MHAAFRQELRFFTLKTLKASGYKPRKSKKLCRIELLLRKYRTEQQFSRFEWSEIEKFVTKLERTQHSYAELAGKVDNYVADVIKRRERK